MPVDERRWHHVILTTYGAWLHGDARGFRTRHHREHVEGNYKRPPPQGKYSARESRARKSLTQDPVKLPPKLRPIVGAALVEKFEKLGAWVLCIAVSGEHVHLLVKLPPDEVRKWCGIAKKHATFVLRDREWSRRVWGARSRAMAVLSRAQQVNTYKYILRHAKEGAWIGAWKTEHGPQIK